MILIEKNKITAGNSIYVGNYIMHYNGVSFTFKSTTDRLDYIEDIDPNKIIIDGLTLSDYTSINEFTLKVNEILTGEVGGADGVTSMSILIGGNPFELKTKDGGETPSVGDLALNGWISSTEFAHSMEYLGGDASLLASWKILESTKN